MTNSQLRAPDPEIVEYNLHRLLGAEIKEPTNLFVLDLETSDVDPLAGVIWQVGYHSVLNGVPAEQTPEGAAIWLKQPVDKLKGATFEISRRRNALRGEEPDGRTVIKDDDYRKAEKAFIEEIYDKGVEPRDAIEALIAMVDNARDGRCILAGQNFVKFDCPWIEYTAKYYGIDFKFPADGLLDTGMIIKAGVLGRRILAHQSYREFYTRVSEVRARGVYFAIERFCIPFWNMDEKYGIDTEKAHDAGYDCYITWLVIKELIEMARGAHVDG
jgi:DNA polymerase III epsilon subunit-like protein